MGLPLRRISDIPGMTEGRDPDVRLPYTAVVLCALALAACQPATVSIPQTTDSGAGGQSTDLPVYVYALCTLMGNGPRSVVPRDRPVNILWGWTTSTKAQMEDYLAAGTVRITYDGGELTGRMVQEAGYDAKEKNYKSLWMAEAGIPAPGVHILTYSVEFSRKITDGIAFYGPGTKNESLSDRCEVEVK